MRNITTTAQAQSNPESTVQPVVYDWEQVPDGLIKGVAYYNYHSAYLSVHEMAVTAGFALMAATCGRAYTTPTGAGLNLYMSLIADTGTGKESVQDTVTTFVKESLLNCAMLEMNMLAPKFASAQGALAHLSDMHHPCCISFIDEYGLYLQRINNPTLKDIVAMELSAFWLSAYSANKVNGFLLGTSYSDKRKNVGSVERPSVSVCGWSTPDNFYKGVDEENVADGMLPRNIFIHYKGERPKSNHNRIAPPPELLEWYRRVADCSKQIEMSGKSVGCRYASGDVEDMLEDIEEKCRDLINGGKNKVAKLLYNRAHLNILKIASLLAVAKNHVEPYILIEHVVYAEQLVMRGIKDVIARFESGKVGQHVGDDPVTEQQSVLMEYINKYTASEWTERFGKTNRITHELFQQRIVNYHYFNVYVRNNKAFIKTGRSQQALDSCLQWAVDVGILMKVQSMGKMYTIMPDGWNHGVPALAPPSPQLKAAYFAEMDAKKSQRTFDV
jgi:hypothetical protein